MIRRLKSLLDKRSPPSRTEEIEGIGIRFEVGNIPCLIFYSLQIAFKTCSNKIEGSGSIKFSKGNS